MDATVVIMSKSNGEVEWEEKITRPTLRGAKVAATKWLEKNVYYDKIEKEDIGDFRSYWSVK